MAPPIVLLLLLGFVSGALAQSNYASQGNDIEYQPGLPPSTILDGKVTKLDDISSEIFLNRTKAVLNCSQGSMEVLLSFEEPFYGIAYANFDRNTACMTKGRGLSSATIELPLKGCGTIQDPQRVFTNNIVVRFHPYLEMDGDEVITIVCRYPPPIAPPNPPSGIIGTVTPAAVTEPSLKGFHILLVICSLLFLALVLLGLGCSYMCLKRRTFPVIHRQQFSSATASEITKLSGSSLGHISMFEGLKIPRAHAFLHTVSTSGSEANLVIEHSDTLPSDYPSESHSEVDEERSLPVSSAGSYEHKAFIHHQQTTQQQIETQASSLYSETIAEVETTMRSMQQQQHPIEPKFDVQMRVKRAPPASPSPLPSESDASIALERNLTTILEREESTSRGPRYSYVPELHNPASAAAATPISRQKTPPVYSRILRKQAEKEISEKISSISPSLSPSPSPYAAFPYSPHATVHRGPRSMASSLSNEMTEARSLTEVTDASHAKYRVASILAPSPPPPPSIGPNVLSSTHTAEVYREQVREEVEPLVEPVVSPRRPEITTHEVDDVFLRTVTEKKTIEDVERHRRQIMEYYAKPQLLPDPKWDVTIRNYPSEQLPPPLPEWENFSDVSSASNLTLTNEAAHVLDEPDVNIEPTYTQRSSMVRDPETLTESFYTLARVLEPQYACEFTDEERRRWKDIITTESTLRTLLTEAVVREDFELIRKDLRYTNLFPLAKWDIIIRILSSPSGSSSSQAARNVQRYKRASKTTEFDNRSRRSSLPTLYEYESDGGASSIKILGQEQARHMAHHQPGSRVRRLSSTTRGGSEADLRSMSEMTVRDFVRGDRDDLTSLSSFDEDSLVRSLSQPSLARSGSEFTEHWGIVPSRNFPNWAIDDDGLSSAETTPRASRRGERNQRGETSRSSTQFREVHSKRESIRITESQQGNWFQDDSEMEIQI